MEETVHKTESLKTRLNDLISLLAMPAIGSGGEQHQIAKTLLDALSGLRLDFVYVRLKESPVCAPIEMIWPSQSAESAAQLDAIDQTLTASFCCKPQTWPLVVQKSTGQGNLSIAAYRLGLKDELDVLIAGSRRTDFPDANETVLLSVAAKLATLELQEARLLGEKRHLAPEVDDRVAQRSRPPERSEFYLSEGQRLTHMGSWSLNRSGVFDYWSPELFRIYGLDAAQGPPTITGYLATLHPDDRGEMAEIVERMLAEGSGCDVKKRIVRPDGVLRYIRCVGVPVFDEGMLKGFIGTAVDVTEQEELTQQLRGRQAYMAEAERLSHTGSFGWSVGSGRIFWSDETFRIFDYEQDTQPSLELVVQRVHPEDKALVQDLLDRVSRDGRNFDVKHRLLLPSGAVKHVHVAAHALRDESGGVEFVGAVMDVTPAKQASTALEKAFQEIETLSAQLYRENIALREEIDNTSMFEEIVGSSQVLRHTLSQVVKVAPTDSTVLVLGETGTGKELIARAIHNHSNRSKGPFICVSCAAIPPSLIASELFGHEKGAFTGALQRRLGRFEAADRGTIFLDEVGELPLETQIALLRVLQERKFERVGGTEPVTVNVRILAATNRDLHAAVVAGTFRQDLFYRLNVFPILVPALRDRKEDIPLLVEYLIERYGKKAGKKIRKITKGTLDLFLAYDWPGNIRELQNVVERAIILCDGETFSVDETWLQHESRLSAHTSVPLAINLVEREKEVIESALADCKGRISGPSGAAARLGIPRQTLEYKLAKLGIDIYRFKADQLKERRVRSKWRE
jgi:formate hydrogenlyase transcriptional activator